MKSDQNIVVGDMVGTKGAVWPKYLGLFGIVRSIIPVNGIRLVNGNDYRDIGRNGEIVYLIELREYGGIVFNRSTIYKIAGPSIDASETTSCQTPIGKQSKVTKEHPITNPM